MMVPRALGVIGGEQGKCTRCAAVRPVKYEWSHAVKVDPGPAVDPAEAFARDLNGFRAPPPEYPPFAYLMGVPRVQ